MKVKQRVLALMLSVMMIVTYMPAIAFAGTEEPAEGDVPAVTDVQAEAEAAEEETAQPEAAEAEAQTEEAGTEAVEEKAAEPEAPAEEPAAPAEETAHGKIVKAGMTNAKLGTEMPSSDELVEQFFDAEVDKALGKSAADTGKLKAKRVTRRSKLNEVEQYVYDGLLEKMTAVAQGNESNTEFTIDVTSAVEQYLVDDSGYKAITSESLGIDDAVAYHVQTEDGDYTWELSEEAQAKLYDLGRVLDAVIIDNPASAYWFDGTKRYSYGDNAGYMSGETSNLYFDVEEGVTVSYSLPVAQAYRASADDEYTFNTAKAAGLKAAVAKVEQIVAENGGETDIDKLYAYKDAICSLTSYNDDAAADDSTPYGDPWQMIYVFDGDNTTNVVCEGYSKAFQYLCDKSQFTSDEIDCHTVSGTMGGGTGAGAHMWNILHMDDNRNYLADITNSDETTVGENGELFLKGYTSGSVDGGYDYSGITYSYDEETRAQYSDSELKMSASNYGEGGSEPADHEISYTTNHVFYENSCGYDDTRYIIDDEYEDYYHYNLDIFEGDVLTVDGEEYVYSTYEGAFVGEDSTISRDDVGISDKQAVEPWVLVNNEDTEVTYGMEYAGSEVTVTATLSPRPEMEIAYTKASPLIEETNGYTDEEGGWWYYYLEPAEGDVLTIDGTEYTYHEEFYDEDTDVDYPQGFYTADYSEKLDASYLTMDSDPDQGEVHWTLGDDEEQKDFNVKVAYKGIETTVTWTLIKNPVHSLSYTTTHEFIENKNCEWQTDEEGDEFCKYYHDPCDGDILTVNGVDYKYIIGDGVFKATDGSQSVIGGGEVNVFSNQNDEHWVIPDGKTETTVTYYVEYMGIQAEVTATLKKNPVVGIEFTPTKEFIDRIFEVDGEWDVDEDGKKHFYYERPRFSEGDQLTVKYNDDRGDVTYIYKDWIFENPDNPDDCIYSGDEDGVNIEVGSSVGWTLGGEYDTTVTYEGYSVSGAKVRIVENPIESISFSRDGSSAIELTEGVDSELDSDMADNNEIIEYQRYNLSFKLGDRITVNKTGGEESAEYVYREIKDGRYTEELFINVNDDSTEITDETDIINEDYLYFDAEPEQGLDNQWKVGQSYKAVVSYYNREANVDVAIKANPVTNITFEGADGSHTVKLYEKVNGYRGDYEDDDGTYKEFFCYYRPSFNAGDKLIVTKDGGMNTYVYTEHLFTGEYYTSGFVNKSEAASEDDYILVDDVNDIDDNQVDPDPWTVGGSGYWFRLKALGCLFKVGAEVLENPVKAFDFSRAGYDANQPIELTEGLDAFVNSDGANNRWFEYYLDYKKGDTITLTDNDDVTSAYNAVPYSESDAYAQYFENEEGKRVRLEDIEQSSDQSKQNVWAADDSTHTISLEYFARTKNVDVKIVKNPVQSLAFTRPGSDSVELIREGDGYWDRNNFYYEINFKEGDELSVTYDGYSEPVKYVATASANGEVEKFVAEGDVPPEAESKISKYDLYYMHNVDWRIDEKPSVMLMYKGMYTDVDVTLTDNQVESFEFVRPGSGDKIELVEGKDGNDEKYNDPDEGLIEWFEYRLFYAEGDVLEVKYAGTDKPVSYVFTESENGGAFIASGSVPAGAPEKIFEDDIRRESTQGYGREWKVGNDYEIKLTYLGKTFAVPVTIVKDTEPAECEHELTATAAKEATCEEAGNRAYWTCSKCGKYFSDAEGKTEIEEGSWVIEATGHIEALPPVSENVKAATCETAGSYDEVVYCAACHKELSKTHKTIEALGHEYGEWLKHDAENHKRVCAHDETHVELAPHSWNDGEITTPATEEGDGVKTYTCTVCGETKTEAVPYGEHEWVFSDIQIVNNSAEAIYRCNAHEDETRSVPAEITVDRKEPTCVEDGYEKLYAWIDADKSLDGQKHDFSQEQTLEAFGHSWADPQYEWSADNSTVTARIVCVHDQSHVKVEETVKTTEERIIPGSGGKEQIKYTAKFENSEFSTKTKTVYTDAVYKVACDDYNSKIEKGESEDFEFTLRRYPNKNATEYEVIDNVRFKMEYPAAHYKDYLTVTEKSKTSNSVVYTFERLENEEAEVEISAYVDNQLVSFVSFVQEQVEEDHTWYLYFPEDFPFESDGKTAIFYLNSVGEAQLFAYYSAWSDYEVTGFDYQWVKGTGAPDESAWLHKSKDDGDYFEKDVTEKGYYTLYVKDGDGKLKSLTGVVKDAPWTATGTPSQVNYTGKPVTLTVNVTPEVSGLTYEWYKYDYDTEETTELSEKTSSITVNEVAGYSCYVSDGSLRVEVWFDVEKPDVDPCEGGHSWDNGEVTTEPTCVKTGIKTYTCTVCGETKTEVIPKLTVEQIEDQIDDAGDKAADAETAAETSTDENDAAEAQAAAEKAVKLAAMAEEAAEDAYKKAQSDLDKLPADASEDQKALAQQNVENAAANLAVAKKLVAAANSTKAKAKKAAAKIASNKAETAAAAAAKAANSATAEEFRKEAEAASMAAAAAAGEAEEASAAAATAAGALDELAEKFADTPVAEDIKAAQTDASTSAGTASDAAGAADSSSTEAKTSADDAQTVVDNKAKAEKEAKEEADRQGVADKTIPKLKISKPSVKKATITAKWKKLTSKQLKKSKATKIEVWVCPNKAFRKADTKIVTVSKKKASAKVKGLKRKTKYFVKVRAIKYVGNVKKVGPWSKTKPIKTK